MKGGLDDAQLGAKELAEGLRALRSQGLLCDVALSAGGEKLPAHQAVLAAASTPLRQYLAEGPEAGTQPLELKMAGGERPEALRALLDRAYASDVGSPMVPGADALARSLAPQTEGARALAAGLRELRAKGALCDLFLVVGAARLPAHQAVLAAASAPLQRYIISGLDELLGQRQAPGGEDGSAEGQVASEPLELELQGVTCAEAAQTFLDHVYAAPGGAALPKAEAAIRDLLRLASAFELPRLRERAAQWLSSGVTSANAPERVSICEEFGFAALGCRIKESAAEQEAPAPEPAPAGEPEAPDGAAERRESPQEAILADPTLMSGMTESECARLFIPTAHFADTSVPTVPGQRTLEAMEQSRRRQDARALERLYDLFDQRPAWLEGSLLKQLPAHVEQSTLLRLLPCVCYQWKDGPWQTAYARYGWDPREHPEEAKRLQVIDFRDPALRGRTRPVARGSQDSSDCHFRRPPSKVREFYQLMDIKDDFIAELIRGSEPSEECSRRTGWLEQVVFEASRERLTVRSQQLRERLAAKEQAEKAKMKAGRPSGGGPGQRAKRARVGGA